MIEGPDAPRTGGSATAEPRWIRRVATHHKSGAVGLTLILAMLFAALLAPLVSPHDPNDSNLAQRLATPGTPTYLLGTDLQGRDILSRLIWGARSSLAITFGALGTAVALGLMIGATAGYLGGRTEALLMRGVDVFFGLPPVLLAILVSISLGPSLRTMIVAMAMVYAPSMVRVAYASVLAVRRQSYIDAARAAGASRVRIFADQVLPNVVPPVLAYSASQTGLAIVFGAGLSFVGLGIQPPEADWGRMINDGRDVLFAAPHVATLPGVAIFITAVAFNLMAESARDALDPRSRD